MGTLPRVLSRVPWFDDDELSDTGLHRVRILGGAWNTIVNRFKYCTAVCASVSELSDKHRAAIMDLCEMHIEDAEGGPQTGVALDEQSLELLKEIRERVGTFAAAESPDTNDSESCGQ